MDLAMKHEEYTLHRFFWPESIAILVIVIGGFSEGGNEGKRLYQEIVYCIRRDGIRTLGPNTLSPVNTANNLIIRGFTSPNSTGSSRIWMWARFWTWATRWISYKRYREEICEKSGEKGDDKNI